MTVSSGKRLLGSQAQSTIAEDDCRRIGALMMRSELTRRRRLLISCALGAALSLVLGWVFPALGSTITYTYDELGRLTGAQYDNGSNLVYKLDPAGNRTLTQSSVDTTPPSVPTGLAG